MGSPGIEGAPERLGQMLRLELGPYQNDAGLLGSRFEPDRIALFLVEPSTHSDQSGRHLAFIHGYFHDGHQRSNRHRRALWHSNVADWLPCESILAFG